MQNYEEKKQARIERLQARIERLEKFAEGKDLSMFGEARSGIPLGQPILVGHHSERRHRRHLERIHKIVEAGYNASKKADELRQRLASIESSNIIQVDNPDAKDLIQAKIQNLEQSIEYSKKINKLLKNKNTIFDAIDYFKTKTDDDSKFIVKYLSERTHWYASKDIRLFYLSTTNQGAEIRRLKKRLVELERVSEGFSSFTVGENMLIRVDLVDGQIQIDFPRKPSEETRAKIKGPGLAFKWSSYSKKWVRKHTASTSSQWFMQELKKALEGAKYE